MSTNKKSNKAEVVNPNIVTIGQYSIELTKTIEVQGQKVECELTHTFLQKSLKEVLAQMAGQDQASIVNVIRQAVYVPKTLPDELINPNSIMLCGRPLPKWEVLHEIISLVQRLNPSHSTREGNSHHVILANGQQMSIGAVCLFGLGIGQSHMSPNGGQAGSYHPLLALQHFYKAGYRALVDTKSALYLDIAGKYQARENEVKAAQEAAKVAPKPKAKKAK